MPEQSNHVRWELFRPDPDGPIHRVPVGDIRQHVTDGQSCWCQPIMEDDLVCHDPFCIDRAGQISIRGKRPPY